MAPRLLLAGLAAWILAQAFRLSWQPLVADEVDFLNAARHWPAQAAMVPHPPGLVHVLRLLFGVFGVHAWVARIPGVLSALTTLAMVPAVTRSLTGDPDRDGAAVTPALLLFGLCPLATQDAMLVDIDNTLMTPMLLAIFLLWHRSRSWSRLRATIALAAAVTAALWFKLPPPLLLMLAIALAEWRWGARDRAGVAVSATLLGGLAFAATLAVHNRWTGYSISAMSGTFRKVSFLSDVRGMLIRAPQNAGLLVAWEGVPLVTLAGLGIVQPIDHDGTRGLPARAAASFVLGSLGFYLLVLAPSYGYPKYEAVLLPFAAAFAGAYVARRGGPAWAGRAWLAAAAAGAIQLAVGDPLRELYRISFTTNVGQLGERIAGSARAIAATALPSLGGLVTAVLAGGRARRSRPVLAAMLAGSGVGAGAVLLTLQSGAPYLTRYVYGANPRELLAAADTVRAHTAEADPVLAPKDVLYYAGRNGRFVSDLVWQGVPPESLLAALDARRFAALAWSSKDEVRGEDVLQDPRVRERIARSFTRRQLGDWIVLLPEPTRHASEP